MNALARLNLLSTDMQLEPAEDALCPQVSRPGAPRRLQDLPEVSDAVLPNGRRIPLLKTLLTSACERNCYYCPFRAGRDFRRATLTPDEMARTFLTLVRGGIAQGLFLSSGVSGNSLRTQDHLIQTAEILRLKYHYRGYLHLKLMPGAERDQVERSMQLADRVSLNLEAPNTKRLEQLAPRKAFLEELLQPLRWVQEIRATQPPYLGWNGRWPSMTTQYVVGAVGESDLELLSTTAYLHQNLHLSRAYFSGFRPVSNTPFENLSPEVPYRQDHLYQASFLLRDYGFSLEDLPFDNRGNLPAHTDPKTAWAQQHLVESPVEINQASREELLKVPGIGPKGATAILAARRSGSINELEQLRKAGVNPSRAVSFILLNGRRPARQLSLWNKP
jgi:predicted DNA-binding helix-hairpin-helix protein